MISSFFLCMMHPSRRSTDILNVQCTVYLYSLISLKSLLVCVLLSCKTSTHSLSPQSREEEVTPGMSLWHEALEKVRSSAQLSLCIQQLKKSIDWDRPVKKVVSDASFLSLSNISFYYTICIFLHQFTLSLIEFVTADVFFLFPALPPLSKGG